MKRFTDFLVNSLPAILSSAAAVIVLILGIVTAVVFPGAAAVVIGLITAAVGLIGLIGIVGISFEWAQTQDRIDALNAEIAELRQAESNVYYAAELPEDDQPDAPTAQKLLDIFDPASPLMENLRIDRGQDLPRAGADQITEFLTAFDKQKFTDAKVHTAFMEVFRAARDLDAWLKAETAEDNEILSIIPGDVREGGWREFSAAASAGDSLSHRVLTACAGFERAALEAEIL